MRLARKRIPHAFGGAIALAYWTLDPRGTSDIDLNVFVPAGRERRLCGRCRTESNFRRDSRGDRGDGQVRLWWDGTPLDLFFDYVPLHEEAERNSRTVPFADTRIPVLGPVELAVFKVMFDRTRDWADIEAMVAANTLDLEAVRTTLATMLEADDPRFARLDEAVRRA